MVKINEAYETLSDDIKREKYDNNIALLEEKERREKEIQNRKKETNTNSFNQKTSYSVDRNYGRNNVKEIQGTGGYINLKEFMDYAKNYGINLDGLITTGTVEYKLLENGISLRLNDFLKKYGIKPVYDLTRDKRYALFNKNEIENAIKEELAEQDMIHEKRAEEMK